MITKNSKNNILRTIIPNYLSIDLYLIQLILNKYSTY